MENNYVGKSTVRPDGADKVSGKAKYAADFIMPNTLHVAVARSTRAHAEILSLDISEAQKEALVFTAKDLAENVIVDIINDRPVLADKKVRYMGEPIAVVAATTREGAIKAAKKIKATYKDLPVYLDGVSALDKNAVNIHQGGNLVGTFENEKGNVKDSYKNAYCIINRKFITPYQEHAYMEPDASFSYMDGDTLVLYTSSQSVFHDRSMVATALGISPEKIRVISATVGGGFGGKDGHMTQIFGALVTQKTGKPAKIVFDRQESIAYTYKRHAVEMNIKMGFKKNGTMVFFEADSIIDTGAYIGYGLSVLGLLSEHIAGPYNIPNVRISSKLVYTNKTPASAFRGFGAPQAAFATETVISEAAFRLKKDPLDLRLKNALKTGDTGSLGQVINTSCGLADCIKTIKETPLWQEYKSGKKEEGIGYGIACGHLSCGFGKGVPDNAEIELVKNGDTYEFYIGLTEIGQGGINSLTSIAADALGVDSSKVKIIMGDTAKTFDCGSTAASRTTFLGGNAIIKAVEEFKAKNSQEESIKIHTAVPFPEAQITKCIGVPHAMYTFVVQAVKVKVDSVTGKVDLLDAVAVTEAGKVINPMQLAGQVQGGMAQSMGYALSENCKFDGEGKLLNDTFSTYILPTASDIPHISALAVDGYESSSPIGVKGAAESPTVPTAAAINSAIGDATRNWYYSLPITAEDVLMSKKEEL